LGEAFAEALANRGLDLILIARRQEKLDALAENLIKTYSIKVKCLALDLTDISHVEDVLAQADLPIGLLVYNAAYAPIGEFETIAADDLAKVVDVNIKAPLLLSKFVSEQMIERKRGGIVLMSSLAGSQGSPKIATYAASKSFNAILAEGLWSELKDHGINVIASIAGAIMTPGYQQAQNAKKAPGTLTPNQVAEKTLKALGKGPTTIPGFTNKLARFFMGRLLPRKSAISIMKKNTESLS
jgi:uncharacterized protein